MECGEYQRMCVFVWVWHWTGHSSSHRSTSNFGENSQAPGIHTHCGFLCSFIWVTFGWFRDHPPCAGCQASTTLQDLKSSTIDTHMWLECWTLNAVVHVGVVCRRPWASSADLAVADPARELRQAGKNRAIPPPKLTPGFGLTSYSMLKWLN